MYGYICSALLRTHHERDVRNVYNKYLMKIKSLMHCLLPYYVSKSIKNKRPSIQIFTKDFYRKCIRKYITNLCTIELISCDAIKSKS